MAHLVSSDSMSAAQSERFQSSGAEVRPPAASTESPSCNHTHPTTYVNIYSEHASLTDDVVSELLPAAMHAGGKVEVAAICVLCIFLVLC